MARRPNPRLIDDDNPELTEEDFAAMRPASEMLPPDTLAALVAGEPKRRPGQRGPGKRLAKVSVSIRIDPGVASAWKASGPGWQARLRDVVARAAPKTKRPA